MNKKINSRFIAYTGITAAVYAVATVMISPLSYGAVQFRFSEIMVLLALLDAGFAPGLILGCIIANLFSPLGIIDVIFGTTATICTMLCITRTKNLFVATLWPTVFCIFVGLELYIVEKLPLLITTLTVMAGEFVVVTLLGYPIFKVILKNKSLVEKLKINN